jgi:hypothetical protein
VSGGTSLLARWWGTTARAALVALATAGCSRDTSVPAPQSAVTRLSACALPADSVRYHIVLDHSGSMRPFWPQVQTQLAATLDVVPSGSWVEVTTFSDGVTPIVNTRKNGEADAFLRAVPAQIGEPARLAPTDLGAALSEAADRYVDVRRSGQSVLTVLFVVTDGRNQPRPGSRFADPAQLQLLAERWRRLSREYGSDLVVNAVGLGSGGVAGTEFVRRIVPDAQVLRAQSPADLGSTMAARLASTGRNVLRTRVEREALSPRLTVRLGRSPQPVPFFGSVQAVATLRSHARCVTYRVRTASRGDGPAEVWIGPGAQAEVPLPLRTALPWARAWPWSGVRRESFSGARALPLPVTVGLEPAGELTDLNVNPATRTRRLSVEGALEYRPIGWLPFAAAAAALVMAILVAVLWRRPPRVWGTVRAEGATLVDLGAQDAREYRVELPNGAALHFRARKVRPLGGSFDTLVGVSPGDGARLKARVNGAEYASSSSEVVWLEPDSVITVEREGAPPLDVAWT